MTDQNAFKPICSSSISNLRIVSMSPGDRKVAGCLMFSYDFGSLD